MRNNKNKKMSAGKVQEQTQRLSSLQTLEVVERGTKVSCKLVEELINTGKGVVGMCAAAYGLAKATVFINELISRKGYDTTAIYNETKQFFESITKTEEYQKMLDEAGL